MARRKQIRPRHAGGIEKKLGKNEGKLNFERGSQNYRVCGGENEGIGTPFYVEVDRIPWFSDKLMDISELVLTSLNIKAEFYDLWLDDDFCKSQNLAVRFRVDNVIKCGDGFGGPIFSDNSVYLEFIKKCDSEDVGKHSVILSGSFDGCHNGISGLVHLAALKFLTLRPFLGIKLCEDISSLTVRVQLLRGVFDASLSLLDNTKQVWRKSMVNAMAWLRPEVTTSEARYGDFELETEMNNGDANISIQKQTFDVAEFYEAIKPSKEDTMLEDNISGLLPVLRPYQRRAVYWMIQREKGESESFKDMESNQFMSPLCMPLKLLDTSSKIFYNPFSGSVSLNPECSSPQVYGGILADEMGLGKTVELLACIFAHQKPVSEDIFLDDALQVTDNYYSNFRRFKKERVECVCGAVTESLKYEGLWVQCDICDAWQHAVCVQYLPVQENISRQEVCKGRSCKGKVRINPRKFKRNKITNKVVTVKEEHVCQLCSEIIQATHSPVTTGATLIVCPSPILKQWRSEITRHLKPGSLAVCIYEGVVDSCLSAKSKMDISELVSADIVLTTYDVLREDLFHDFDRHQGDRRSMRFKKRYPVTPTPLTRILWWRICLDEAQMVECNANAATEMAMRLHAKHRWCVTGTPIQRRLDDLHGLLKFLKASPFDVFKWWNEVIQDPYEKRDVIAMKFTYRFFRRIIYRSMKIHVADELLLPPQEACLTRLILSPIEEYFYQRQHEKCVRDAREVIEYFKDGISKRGNPGFTTPGALSNPIITHTEATRLLNSLLKLRQACCHPQVGSYGLPSLQKSPMSMEAILQVLVHKTKIEGEEALRGLICSINGLAGIAIINQDFSEAISLYREALVFTDEHSDDFSLDPLLNIHIHYNLAEVLEMISDPSQNFSSNGRQLQDDFFGMKLRKGNVNDCINLSAKRRKISSKEGCSASNRNVGELFNDLSTSQENGSIENRVCNSENHCLSSFLGLRTACESMKKKFLSTFNARLDLSRQEFRKSYLLVCHALSERKDSHKVWWLEVLDNINGSENSSNELIRKIVDAVSLATCSLRSSRTSSRFRSINTIKYHIQTTLDLLETSRKSLVDQLLAIDQTMECPREDDIGRVRNCPDCNGNGDAPKCVHCELDDLFQVYEARLFRSNDSLGGVINSAEEVVDLQTKKSKLNRFWGTLTEPNKNIISSRNEKIQRKRDVGQGLVISRSPSVCEIILGVLKSYFNEESGNSVSPAAKHLQLLESMRKEYAHARSLASAQAQLFRAHDEIKMSTSRLRLRRNEDDNSADALCLEELVAASIENSSVKFTSLASLSRIKGQLRYLEGLVQSEQNLPQEPVNNSTMTNDTAISFISTFSTKNNDSVVGYEEDCPVCQEKLKNQKMVFCCGHVTCCKCLFAMTEQRLRSHESLQAKLLLCPKCRQPTKFENIACADDRKKYLYKPSTHKDHEISEGLITVQGSYGSKIEAITRRIIWIKSADPTAKVLVFSSWNDVLDVLEHAFTANQVSHIRMKGGRKSEIALSRFTQESEAEFVQVMLLLVQHGANGLNLLEARHVILVEPLLNPAAEAQAISRVHRIGQRNQTLVHRFIVNKTVEEGIYKLNENRDQCHPIGANTAKNHDQQFLTLKDVEFLFQVQPLEKTPPDKQPTTSGLRHHPPSVAAAIAAERRLQQPAI